jgi:signal transduction histidine kinase
MDVRANGKISAVSAAANPGLAATELARPPHAQVPHRGYWLCQIIGWCAVFAIGFSFMGFAGPQYFWPYATIYGFASIAGLLLSHGWRRVLIQRAWLDRESRPAWLPLVLSIVALGVVQTILVGSAFFVVRPPGLARGYAWLPGAIASWTFMFAAWTALYAMVQSRRRVKRLEAERLRLQVLAKDAELRALQSQINPHFYFNSLNSLRALIFENPHAAANVVDQLAGLMRYALQSGETETVTLREEVTAVRAYLAIEKVRFEERLQLRIDIDPACEDAAIPPMVLQTLVENAVKYGVEPRIGGSEVTVRATRTDDIVRIEVINRGTLAAHADSTRIGLANAERRLALLCGAGAAVTLTARDEHVVATIVVPANRAKT